MTWHMLLGLIVKVFGSVVKLISPELRQWITDLVVELYKKAKATDNPWDDFLVELLATILGIDLPSE